MSCIPCPMARERDISAAHRNYPRQFGGGISRILHVLRRKQWVEDFCYVALGPRAVNHLTSPHRRGGGAGPLALYKPPPTTRGGGSAPRTRRRPPPRGPTRPRTNT